MFCLVAAVVLVSIAPWACDGEREYILYDFWTKHSAAKVADTFHNVNVAHQFQVYGVGRFIVVVKNDQSADMKFLRLPRDAQNVRTFPLEHLDTFYTHFGPFPREPVNHLPDGNLTMVELTWNIAYSEKELKALMEDQAAGVLENKYKDIDAFVATAFVPLKFFFFLSRSNFDTAELFLKGVDGLGGYGRIEIVTQRLFKI